MSIRYTAAYLQAGGGGSNTPVNPDVGALVISGYAPTVTQTANQSVDPGVGSVALTGYAPSVVVSDNAVVNPGVGAILLTGHAPTISQPLAVNPDTGAITITGYAPSITQGVTTNIAPGTGTVALSGYAPTVVQTNNVAVGPGEGVVTITGYAPSITQPQAVAPDVGAIVITGYAPAVTQGQTVDPRYARPSTDVTPGSWLPSTGTSLAAMLDEATADDADYIYTASPGPCEIALNPVQDPGTSSGQVVRYRVCSATSDGLTVALMQGATTIASWTHATLPTDFTTYEQVLTTAQCDSITDYTDLRLDFTAA